jgi:hypothetical protein
MRNHELNRRDFSKLTMAAFGGMLAGTAASTAAQEKESKKDSKKSPLLVEPHVCRGLNTCKGKGKGGDNACAGQGNCATVEAHSCKGESACRGQGGCGAKPGENACKGMGGCSVPMEHQAAWKKARARFEQLMAQAGQKVGPAPPAK